MFDVQTAVPADETTTVQSAAPAAPAQAAPAAAAKPTPLPLRNDTLLGVCEAIGQDFGFNANLLRIALAIGLFFTPVGMIALYLGLGAAVAASRWFFPTRTAAKRAEASPATQERALPLAA